jgi:hypothetical protein
MFPIARRRKNIKNCCIGKASCAGIMICWRKATAAIQGGRHDRLLVAAQFLACRRFS